ncbi:MAG TPA: pyridoxal phosphate-dependent aminotransferase, partial [Bacteroidetes bacterium]|nr:pyridoxal phosphate-dependent aminotransferase [Bacteroidota bacterium]
KLVPYADEAKARGIQVYHLNIGQPDIKTPPQFMEAVRNANLDVLSYSHSQGIPSVVDKFIQYYHRNEIPLTKKNLLVTTGGSEALSFAFMAAMDYGDEVIIPEPFYANYNGFSIATGAVVVPITTHLDDNFDLPETEEFEKLITPRTRAILICNPSNPTGKLYSKAALIKLSKLVLKHDLFLVVDEVYREFVYDGEKHFSALKLEGMAQHVIVIDSISKRYSACGARIGNLVSYNEDIIATALKYAQARLSPPTLAQIGAEAVIDVAPSYLQEVNTEYQARRDTLVRLLSAIPGVEIPQVSGAFYMTVRLPVDNTEAFCQWILENFSYQGATVMMAPASGFYATPGLGLDEVRIAYVLSQPDLKKAMTCLSEALKVYPGTKVQATATTST